MARQAGQCGILVDDRTGRDLRCVPVCGFLQAGVAQLVEHLVCNQAQTALNSFIPNIFNFWVDVSVDGDASFAEFWVDVGRNGAGNEDRTRDLKITNLALYRLSYPGLAPLYRTVRTGSSKPHSASFTVSQRSNHQNKENRPDRKSTRLNSSHANISYAR